jgi:hypothetical protein
MIASREIYSFLICHRHLLEQVCLHPRGQTSAFFPTKPRQECRGFFVRRSGSALLEKRACDVIQSSAQG